MENKGIQITQQNLLLPKTLRKKQINVSIITKKKHFKQCQGDKEK